MAVRVTLDVFCRVGQKVLDHKMITTLAILLRM